MAVHSRMSPLTSSQMTMDTKHQHLTSSPPYNGSPYHLSPGAHSSPASPRDHPNLHHSTPSPRQHETSGNHTPMWLGTPNMARNEPTQSPTDQDGPLNLSKPRGSDYIKRERSSHDDHPNFSFHSNKQEVTTPPPAHSNHRRNSNLHSPTQPPTPPKVSIPDSSMFSGVRPPYLPPQYTSPFLGLAAAGHLPISVLSNMNNNFSTHSAFLMNGAGKLPGMDGTKVTNTTLSSIVL